MADSKNQGMVARNLPAVMSDGTAAYDRDGRYGEKYVIPLTPNLHALADEGSYFVATNPAPGAAIAYGVQAAFSDTNAFLIARNNDLISNMSAKRVYLDYIKLICTVVPASATSAQFAVKSDGPSSLRYTSGGTQIAAVNTNNDSNTGSMIGNNIWAGTPVLAASSSSARLLARGVLNGAIPGISDEYVIKFGSIDGGGNIRGGTASTRLVVNAPPIIIGPQQWISLHLWFPANAATAPTFEMEMGWFER
jgi:hypothetical protein